MEGAPSDRIREHIASIAARTPAQGARLAAMIASHPWPTGAADETQPAARSWLSRWRPAGPQPMPVACGCAAQQCQICN